MEETIDEKYYWNSWYTRTVRGVIANASRCQSVCIWCAPYAVTVMLVLSQPWGHNQKPIPSIHPVSGAWHPSVRQPRRQGEHPLRRQYNGVLRPMLPRWPQLCRWPPVGHGHSCSLSNGHLQLGQPSVKSVISPQQRTNTLSIGCARNWRQFRCFAPADHSDNGQFGCLTFSSVQ